MKITLEDKYLVSLSLTLEQAYLYLKKEKQKD